MSEIDVGAMIRAARREADLSQRELAELTEVPLSTVSRIESGAVHDPRFRTLERLLAAARRRTDRPSDDDVLRAPLRPVPHDDLRDEQDRHYPAHLDVLETLPMFSRDGAFLPVGTRVHSFHRSRGLRDMIRQDNEPGERLTIECHERAVGRAWLWLARDDDDVVARMSAQFWPPANEAAEPDIRRRPAKPVVLCCLVVAPGWMMCGVERRLIASLRTTVVDHGDPRIVTLAYPGLSAGQIRTLGFHTKIDDVQLFQLAHRNRPDK